jgi:hypothetical protein
MVAITILLLMVGGYNQYNGTLDESYIFGVIFL